MKIINFKPSSTLFIKTICIVLIYSLFGKCNAQFYKRRATCDILNSDGNEYLLDQESRKCFKVGTRGPCGEFMTFYKNPIRKSIYGFCDCDTGFESELPCKDSPIRRRVYFHKHRRCYTVFSQGPCKKNEWLVLKESDDSGICVPNRCKNHGESRSTSDQFWFYDAQRSKCYLSLTQGYCPEGETLELVHESQYPRCERKQCFSSLLYGVSAKLSCKAGSRFSYLTNACRRTFTNLFGIGK